MPNNCVFVKIDFFAIHMTTILMPNWPNCHKKTYAVVYGRHPGIYNTWKECKAVTAHFPCAKFKSFGSRKEALKYMLDHNSKNKATSTTTNMNWSQKVKMNVVVATETEVQVADDYTYYVYTDGACRNNGRPGAEAGSGIWFGKGDSRNESLRLYGKQTNNTAEVRAILKACDTIVADLADNPVKEWVIVTDSMYALRYATTLGNKHSQEDWIRDIPNKALVRELHRRVSSEPRIKMMKVAAHTGYTDPHSLGNAQADRLANLAIQQKVKHT